MNSSLTARTILLYVVLLPLAVVFGYVVASPLDYTNLGVIGAILAALLAPLLIRYHHPLIICCWNAFLTAFLMPGELPLWIPMAFVTLAFAALHRIIDKRVAWVNVPSVTISLVALLLVILVTAQSTGGIGVRALGGGSFGGKNYFYVFAAIAGYFAISSTRIPVEKANRYLGLFYLPAITAVVGHIAFALGPAAYFLFHIFPSDLVMKQATAESSGSELVRLGGVSIAAVTTAFYLVARFGLAGILDLRHPFRLLLFLLLCGLSLLGGFRSTLVIAAFIFGAKFVIEGLWRTRLGSVLALMLLLAALIVVPNASRLPLSMQRALSVLPIEVDAEIRQDAWESNEWRKSMWRVISPTLPNYLIRGRGYNMDPTTLYLTEVAVRRGYLPSYEAAIVTLAFHSGFLTTYVPFGSFGFTTFVIFLLVALRALYKNYRFGDPRLRNVNEMLLASFLAKVVFFFVIFGSFHTDLAGFTGMVGFSIALNNGVARKPRSLLQSAPPLRFAAVPLGAPTERPQRS